MAKIKIVDHSQDVKKEIRARILKALEVIGGKAEGYAVKLAPVREVNGGTLRNSITHKVVEDDLAAYVGTNVEYAPYVELGTGKYYKGGRQTPWVYQDAEGKWHMTEGQRAQPFLKPSIADHIDEYKWVFEQEGFTVK